MTNSIIALPERCVSILALMEGFFKAFSGQNPILMDEAEEEKRLILRAVQDPKAFDDLYRKYVNRVYAYHLVRTNSREEAEDLTSQTFLSALECLSGFRNQGNFSPWLFSIARRKLIDHYRRAENNPVIQDCAATNNLEETIDHKLTLQQVSQALLHLDHDRVEALSLRVFGQLSAAETGQILSKSEGAVRNLVYRAIKDLREQLIPAVNMEEK